MKFKVWVVQILPMKQQNVIINQQNLGEREVKHMAKIVIKVKLKIKKWVVGVTVVSLLEVCGVFPTRSYAPLNA
jgi:hypothetical protein